MKTNTQTLEFFASCGRGLEGLLADELRALGIKRVRPLSNGAAFFGSIEDGMRACLWLRTASRVLLIVDRIAASDSDTLYNSLYKLKWEDHIADTATFAIDAYGRNDNLRNSQFVAVRAKDAIVDRIREKSSGGVRPNISRVRPDVLVNLNLRGEKATIAIDLSGEPLHRRGYRVESRAVHAPLKENLAAAMLLAADWRVNGETPRSLVHAREVQGDNVGDSSVGASVPARPRFTASYLLDPFCGSGTIVLEAALIASDRAPGLLRDYWGFQGWKQYDEDLWFSVLDEADERAAVGAEMLEGLSHPLIIAGDSDAPSLQAAVESAKKANLAKFIDFKGDLSPATTAEISQKRGGVDASHLLVTNPPYGQRLSSEAQLPATYAELTAYIKAFEGGRAGAVAIITPDGLSETYINNALGTEPTKRLKTMNGPIESDIRIWTLGEPASVGARVPARPLDDAGSDLAGERGRSTLQKGEGEPNTPVQGVTHVTPRSDAGSLHAEQGTATAAIDSTEFRNRLTKMAKHRAKWARRAGVSCYRVYDADLPDFKVAIDLYQGAAQTRDEGKKWLHIAEYRAPKEVDEATAHARLAEVLRIAPEVLDVRTQDVFLKRREQAKGGSQYQQSSDSKKSPGYHIINEGGLKFEVDLASKLDTGIFLDHRQVRNLLRDKAAGRDCLNLFAYTGSASVYMADGAAKSVTTVDLSQTYLDWAQRNMALNRLDLKRGLDLHYEKADVLRWVADQRAQRKPAYDLIFCDVPTFSNSTAMGKKTWDVQRDHVELLISISRLLRHDGEAVFSTNLRNFKPDLEALEKARVSLQNISTQTVPPDYERSPSIHHCFVLKRLPLS